MLFGYHHASDVFCCVLQTKIWHCSIGICTLVHPNMIYQDMFLLGTLCILERMKPFHGLKIGTTVWNQYLDIFFSTYIFIFLVFSSFFFVTALLSPFAYLFSCHSFIFYL